MTPLTRFYYVILAALVVALILINKAHAMEVSPDIGFQHSQSPNGSEYDSNGANRARMENQKGALNDRLFHDHQISKAIPDVNSVGMNFTFKLG